MPTQQRAKPTEVGGRREAKNYDKAFGNKHNSINQAFPTVGKGVGMVFKKDQTRSEFEQCPINTKNLPSLGKNFFFALNKIKLHNE